MPNETASSQLKVVGTICFYIVAALVMVFVNKAVLNETPDLTFTFLFIQFSISVLLLRFLVLLSRTPAQRILPCNFDVPSLDRSTANKLVPFLVVGWVGLVFNTLCLKKVDATFFQIARGLTLPFTILVSSIFARIMPKGNILIAATIVTFGFFVGVAPSFSFAVTAGAAKEPLRALLYGFISCMVLALHTVLSKVATSTIRHSVLTISYWGNVWMAVMTIPLIVFRGELQMLNRRLESPDQVWTRFILGSLVTGVFGFLLGIANILSIKVTSPISHMFSAAAKSVIQSFLGVIFFGDVIDIYRVTGIISITGGTMFYTWTRSQTYPSQPGTTSYTPIPVTDVEKQELTEKYEETEHSVNISS